ncbi:MAG: Gfo/Idh/MocA family oxidoreductase [Candidatus Sumerlaeota bacterium]|nr:Gfo/Idh/MocA family oxidoreductase [Candidatus Sumerlaeota bacterium]
MPHQFHISRRSFIKRCSLVAAATGLPLWFVEKELSAAEAAEPSAPGKSPNSRPGFALIGCGGQGQGDAMNAANEGDIVAVCDVDQGHVDGAAKRFTKDGKTPAKYTDFRKLLENKDVQAVINGTPDHWHSLINIAAAKAGKDIYSEKPLTLTIDEGRRVIKAVRDNKVVLQTGTQQRSSFKFRMACELVRNGRIGKLKEVHVFVPAGLREGPFAKAPVPNGFNYDFWLGQAPQADYTPKRCHATFRWWYDYAGGPVTDWGAHHNDCARWGMGQEGPVGIEAQVVTPPIPGGYTTPSEFAASLTWANGVKQIVKTTLDDAWNGGIIKKDGQRNGIKFIGETGWIWVNREQLNASEKQILTEKLPDTALRLEVSDNHMKNFVDSMRSRKDPIANVETGHRSSSVGHLIIIALRTGLKLQWDPDKEVFTGEGAAEANKHIARDMRKPYDYTFIG